MSGGFCAALEWGFEGHLIEGQSNYLRAIFY